MWKNNDFLYLVWKDPETRRNFTVGKLSRNTTNFTFEYIGDALSAESYGWKKLDAFPKEQKYESTTMFPIFASRLPDRKRKDIDKILKKYGLTEFDAFELLKKCGARLPIDTYEFINPIFPDDETVQRDFFVMGIRHHAQCKGENCNFLPSVAVGDVLTLVDEPDNAYDPFAIRVLTQANEELGYIPRYYNREILARVKKGMAYSCVVLEVNRGNHCSECVKVRLNMTDSKSRQHLLSQD